MPGWRCVGTSYTYDGEMHRALSEIELSKFTLPSHVGAYCSGVCAWSSRDSRLCIAGECSVGHSDRLGG
jgi:hypothetical protein